MPPSPPDLRRSPNQAVGPGVEDPLGAVRGALVALPLDVVLWGLVIGLVWWLAS